MVKKCDCCWSGFADTVPSPVVTHGREKATGGLRRRNPTSEFLLVWAGFRGHGTRKIGLFLPESLPTYY